MHKQEDQIDNNRRGLRKSGGVSQQQALLLRAIWFSFILAGVAICLCAAQSNKGEAPAISTQITKKGVSNLVCRISVQKTEWQQPQASEVGLVIENRLDSELSVSVVPALTLRPPATTEEPQKSELGYMALWNWDKGTTLPPSATVPLQLKSGSSKKVFSDIASLLWSRTDESAIPHSKLSAVVPPGRYSLRLVLTGRHGKALCSSNIVNVLIK
jgi:hypothetical protein